MGVVRLECHECGSPDCVLLDGEFPDSWIACSTCHAKLITFGQLHAEIARQACLYATTSIRGALGLTDWRQDNDRPKATRALRIAESEGDYVPGPLCG
jgi:hypothetical protein